MKPETAKAFIPLLQAIAEGKTVQRLCGRESAPPQVWADIDSNLVKLDVHENPARYRIKPDIIHPPFGDAPEGFTWHNPHNLTPEQVETGNGWRLCLKEEAANLPDQGWISAENEWVDTGSFQVSTPYGSHAKSTYRTKAPLPMTERQRYNAWAEATGRINYLPTHHLDMWEAWKAAKADKP